METKEFIEIMIKKYKDDIEYHKKKLLGSQFGLVDFEDQLKNLEEKK